MPRAKGSKLTQEHKDLLRKKALEYHAEIRKLKENVRTDVENDNKKDAGENGQPENNISGYENDNRISTKPETLEVEKGELKKMDIPKKEPENIEVYNCANCQGELTMGVKFCPHCGCQLDWSVAS